MLRLLKSSLAILLTIILILSTFLPVSAFSSDRDFPETGKIDSIDDETTADSPDPVMAGIDASVINSEIAADTLWTLEDSPYVITSSVLVASGATLIIEPGVTIRFEANKGMQIEGCLVARGTVENPITFTSNQIDPTPGDWVNLNFAGSSVDAVLDDSRQYLSGCVLQYCVVEYGGQINLSEAAPLIDNCIIRDNAGDGISVSDSEFGFIFNNQIISNFIGIYIDNCKNMSIDNNTIEKNLEYGIFSNDIYGNYGTSSYITNNRINCNSSAGIYAYGTYSGLVQINGNTINHNRGGGIYSNWCTTEISENVIVGNSAAFGAGICVYRYNSTIQNNIILNNIAEYSGGGIYAKEAALLVTGNLICNNTSSNGGIVCSSSGTSIRNNDIYDNTPYDIYTLDNQNAAALNAVNNWWGTVDEALIQTCIYDWYDNANLTRISYTPYATAPVSDVVEIVYTLHVSSTEGGSVVIPGDGVFYFNLGEVVDLAAVPLEGYQFLRWSGDIESINEENEASTTIAMYGDNEITAEFIALNKLNISSTEGGSIVIPGDGVFYFNLGEVVDLAAVPLEGYQFLRWSGDIESIDEENKASTTIAMYGDYEITAEFIALNKLHVSSMEGGSVVIPGDGVFYFNLGEVVDLAAVPLEGYQFLRWSGDIESIDEVNEASTTITMNGDYEITAEFVTDDSGTVVNENILEDTLWSRAASPYFVESSVLVASGATLTIEPGVTVLFELGRGLQVEGCLFARGNSENPITFTSNQSSPAAGDWVNLYFTDSAVDAVFDDYGYYQSGSVMQYCTVEYGGKDASPAINFLSSSPWIANCVIQNNGGEGISVSSVESGIFPKIDNCTILSNRGCGISVNSIESGIISNSEITGNHGVGLRITNCNDFTISNNNISNSGTGIEISDCWDISVSKNQIVNSANGICLDGECNDISVISNEINQNYGYGVSVGYKYSFDDCLRIKIKNNSISNNACGGIYIVSQWGSCNGNIANNTISNNGSDRYGGIVVSKGDLDINNNIITNNQAQEGGGIYSYESDLSILNNTISGNAAQEGGGIYSYESDLSILNNTISGNTAVLYGGLYANEGTISATNNLIYDNTANNGGVVLGGSVSANFKDNDIRNNSTYDVCNLNGQSTTAIDATDNWWGTADEYLIKEHIYDWYDNAGLGRVDYSPFLTSGDRYSLNILIEGEGNVEPGSGVSTYLVGREVTIKAIADHGWRFSHWSGDITESTERRATLTMDADKTVTAVFAVDNCGLVFENDELEYEIRTAIGKPDGLIYQQDLETITSLDCDSLDISDIAWLEYCSNLTRLFLRYNRISDISALSDLIYLERVYLDHNQISDLTPLVDNPCIGENDYVYLSYNSLDLTTGSQNMTDIQTLIGRGATVSYQLQSGYYSLNVFADGYGEISAYPPQDYYLEGSLVEITAMAENGWIFSGWLGDASGTTNPLVITMDEDKTIYAVFEEISDFSRVLYEGWNYLSTPFELESSRDTLGSLFDTDALDNILIAYAWEGEYWVQIGSDYQLKPLTAICVRIAEGETALAVFKPSSELTAPPSRSLSAGLNLIGPAPVCQNGTFIPMSINESLSSIAEAANGYNEYTMVISPGNNQTGWIYSVTTSSGTEALLTPTSGGGVGGGGAGGEIAYYLKAFRGYWVVMDNPDVLYGFSTTPVEEEDE